jgi:hypothetical protein
VKLGSMDKILMTHGKKLHTRQKLSMCEQICSGMLEIASVGVLHRDLAGRNILVACLDPVHVKVCATLHWLQMQRFDFCLL